MPEWNGLARRLAVCVTVQQTRLRQWWESLSPEEQRIECERRLGPGSLDWIEETVQDLTLAEIETTSIMWDRYEAWRARQPWATSPHD